MFQFLNKIALLIIIACTQISLSLRHRPSFSKEDIMKICGKRVNLLRKKWFMRSPSPQLDQGATGLCYSYAAASYFDLWRTKHIKNTTFTTQLKLPLSKNIKPSTLSIADIVFYKNQSPTAPLWLAYLYSKDLKSKRHEFDGGIDEVSLQRLLDGHGSCHSDIMKKSLQPFTKKQEELIPLIEFYALTRWIMNNQKIIKPIILSHKSWRKKFQEIIALNPDKDQLSNIQQQADFRKIYISLKKYLPQKDYRGYFENVFSSCFKKSNQYKEINSKSLNSYRICSHQNTDVFDNIEIILSLLEKNEPVLFSYNSEILTNPKLKPKKEYSGDHSSIIVGKRVRKDRCELLVQNSWGDYCDYGWPCQKDENGKEIGIWIDAFHLLKQTSDLTYLENKKESCFKRS